jgi:hypothetical protein
MGKDGYGQQAESGRKIKVVYAGCPGVVPGHPAHNDTLSCTLHTPKSFLNRDAK